MNLHCIRNCNSSWDYSRIRSSGSCCQLFNVYGRDGNFGWNFRFSRGTISASFVDLMASAKNLTSVGNLLVVTMTSAVNLATVGRSLIAAAHDAMAKDEGDDEWKMKMRAKARRLKQQ